MEATHTLFADFLNRPEADHAVNALERMGYNAKDISVIAKEGDDKAAATTSATGETAKGALSGATTGGVIGGVAGLLAGVGVVPAIAGILIGGPVAAALGLAGVAALTVSGVVTGAVAGGLIGALTKLDVSKEDAEYYDKAVQEGRVVLGVPVSDENENAVRSILENYQGEDVKSEPALSSANLTSDVSLASADGMTRSEEELVISKQQQERGRVRLVKHVITENVNVTVPLRKEVAHLEREPIVDGKTVSGDLAGNMFQDETQGIVLSEEVADVHKKIVAKEHVHLAKEIIELEQQVSEQVRKETIDVKGQIENATP